MKTLRQLSIIGLTVILGLTSCTMEKRVYMSGYHIEWLNGKHSPDKQTANNETKSKTVTDEQLEIATNTADNSSAPTANEENITASVDKSILVTTSPEQNYFSSANSNLEDHTVSSVILLAEKKIITKFTDKNIFSLPEIKKKNTSYLILEKKDDDKKSGIFGILSLSFSVLAIAGTLLIIPGVILGLLAIIFGAIGMGKKRKLKGLATAGFVLGILIFLVAGLLLLLAAA